MAIDVEGVVRRCNGKPIKDAIQAMVWVLNGTEVECETDSVGVFHVQLPNPGNWKIYVNTCPARTPLTLPITVPVVGIEVIRQCLINGEPDPKCPDALPLLVGEGNGLVVGRVRNADGSRVQEDAQVIFQPEQEGDVVETLTDEVGLFTQEMPAGPYGVLINGDPAKSPAHVEVPDQDCLESDFIMAGAPPSS